MDIPGTLHHIMIRGINKAAVFEDDEDKGCFLERLGEYVTAGKSALYAWVVVIALRSRNEFGLSSPEIARHVGVNTSSITRAIERAEARRQVKHYWKRCPHHQTIAEGTSRWYKVI
jgi:hypothetical protein